MFSKSESIDQLATALAKAQGEMKGAEKASTNPHFRSKYASLESVVDAYRDAFAANGLSLTQHPDAKGADVTVTTLVMHVSGQWMSSDLTLTAKDAGPQAIGSAITYARRYSALAVAGLAPEDDDGEAAEARPAGGFGTVQTKSAIKPIGGK